MTNDDIEQNCSELNAQQLWSLMKNVTIPGTTNVHHLAVNNQKTVTLTSSQKEKLFDVFN